MKSLNRFAIIGLFVFRFAQASLAFSKQKSPTVETVRLFLGVITFGDHLWGVIQMKSLDRFAIIGFFCFSIRASELGFLKTKKPYCRNSKAFHLSGWCDSNTRPSGPKPDALTGLRYTPKF